MSINKPLKRYGPETEYDAPSPYPVMREVPGGNYIDEDELRVRLGELMNAARSRDELDAYKRVMEMIDTPNW